MDAGSADARDPAPEGSQSSSSTAPAVTTHHNDAMRSGANLSEGCSLAPWSRTTSACLGRCRSTGKSSAQPLYVPNVAILNQGTHNVLYVVTEHDSVYAFDADNLSVLWQRSLILSGESSVPCSDYPIYCGAGGTPGYKSLSEVGITSTPVIDAATNTLYVVAETKVLPDTTPHVHRQRLRALDITQGTERSQSPALIQGVSGSDTFDPGSANQRAALLLSQASLSDGVHKVIDVAWASYGDRNSSGDVLQFKGWVMSFDAVSLAQRGIWCNGCGVDHSGGGIWQAGAGLAADANGDLYFMTGNGTYDGVSAFGDSVLRLHLDGAGLHRVDWFTPADQLCMLHYDSDLGSAGPVLLPDLTGAHPHQILGGGKTAKLYLMDRDNLGHNDETKLVSSKLITDGLPLDAYNTSTCYEGTPPGSADPYAGGFAKEGSYHLHGSPVLWPSSSGLRAYVWSEQNYLRCYRVDGSAISSCGQSTLRAPLDVVSPAERAMPGGFLSVTAATSGASAGIVWACVPSQAGDAGTKVLHGVLRAFDAVTLAEIWNSDERYSDFVGDFAKFNAPTVANGKVYLPTWHNPDPIASGGDGYQNRLLMYGVLPTVTSPVAPDAGAGAGHRRGRHGRPRRVRSSVPTCSRPASEIHHWSVEAQSWDTPAGAAAAIDDGPKGPGW